MKILHTSDWHLGIKIPSPLAIPRLDEQAKILEKIKKIIEEKNIDVVLIAGDIFEIPLPSIEAEKIFLKFLSDIAGDLKKYVLFINGNHDSGEKIDNLNILSKISNNRIKAFTDTRLDSSNLTEKLIFNIDDISFVGIPFIPKYMYSGEYRNIFERLISEILKKTSDTVVLFSHDTIEGAIYSDTEVKYDDKSLDPNSINKISNFNKVIYWALGHIHKYQKITENIWYSGSIIQTNFGEKDQSKYVIICEIEDTSSLPRITPLEIEQEFLLKQYKINEREDVDKLLEEYQDNWFVKVVFKNSYNEKDYILDVEKIKSRIKNPIINKEPLSGNNLNIDINNIRSSINDPIEMYKKYCEQVLGVSILEEEINYLKKIYDEVKNPNQNTT